MKRMAWLWVVMVAVVLSACLWWARTAGAQPSISAPEFAADQYGGRYYLSPLLVSEKGDNLGYDLYLVDSQTGRVWVWPHRKDRQFVPVPVLEHPTQ